MKFYCSFEIGEEPEKIKKTPNYWSNLQTLNSVYCPQLSKIIAFGFPFTKNPQRIYRFVSLFSCHFTNPLFFTQKSLIYEWNSSNSTIKISSFKIGYLTDVIIKK